MAPATTRVAQADLLPGMVYKTRNGRPRWCTIHTLGDTDLGLGDATRTAVASYLNGNRAGEPFHVRLYHANFDVQTDTLPAHFAPTLPEYTESRWVGWLWTHGDHNPHGLPWTVGITGIESDVRAWVERTYVEAEDFGSIGFAAQALPVGQAAGGTPREQRIRMTGITYAPEATPEPEPVTVDKPNCLTGSYAGQRSLDVVAAAAKALPISTRLPPLRLKLGLDRIVLDATVPYVLVTGHTLLPARAQHGNADGTRYLLHLCSPDGSLLVGPIFYTIVETLELLTHTIPEGPR